MPFRRDKINANIRHLAAQFLEGRSGKLSLITVTDSEISDDSKRVRVLISVFPEKEEKKALAFVNRQRIDFYEYIKKHLRTRSLPHIKFAIDVGEKNRQRIEELLKKSKE